MRTDKKELKLEITEKMRKMFFSAPVINKYLAESSVSEIASLNQLLDAEQELRTVSRRARYIKNAGFPSLKSFTGYDFSNIAFPGHMGKEAMLTLDFVKENKTIVFFGGCGTGKTHAMTALGILACNNDYRVRFFTLSSLVMYLKNAKNSGTMEHVFRTIANCQLLCIDEFSYIPLDLESAQLLFTVISNAYERQSLIITTNLPFNEWGPMFSDDQIAAAIIDRIVHYGHLIKTGNKDWRLEHSLMIDI